MRVFKTKPFARFAAKEGIADAALRDAIRRAEAGLVDADLGGGVIKQRLARPGKGSRVALAASCCSEDRPQRSSSTASQRTIVTTLTGKS
jgi:hypothetical protein